MKTTLPPLKGGRVLADWVTDSLREAILHGHFEAGEKLNQAAIAQELKVSRTPIREALKRLESEGFVEIRPHRGAFISKVSPQDVQEVYQVRQLLEVDVVRRVTPIIPDEVLDELERLLTLRQSELKAGDSNKYYDNDTHFHDTILSFTENDLVKEILGSLSNRIIRVRRYVLLHPDPTLLASIDEHHAILQAMRQRDPEAAAEAMGVHLEKSAQRVLALT
jgi:DNA-binding GntR family transcriptional regulator